MAELTIEIVEGAEPGRRLTLDRPLDIGRDPSMPLSLEHDAQASRRHARLTPQDDLAIVEDLGSANGTFVNDQPIHSPRAVRPGDRVRVGLTVLELRSAQQVEQRASAVRPRPQVTEVGGVLAPAAAHQLGGAPASAQGGFAPVGGPSPTAPPPAAPAAPAVGPGQAAPVGFRAAETPAAYVPAEVVGDQQGEDNYTALAHLVDPAVKRRRDAAAFALLAAAGLAVVLFFGLT